MKALSSGKLKKDTYALTWYKLYRAGKKMFIDNFNMIPWKPIYGAPIGGIGCGTIGRGYRGEFCRFQMIPGMYKYHVVDADQFVVCVRRGGQTVYQQVLSPHKPRGKRLSGWNWDFPGENITYHALYPRSWTVYELPGQNIRLICRQVSPVFPHNYKDTSLPCAVFVWTVENRNPDPVEVSIMFSFKNGQGAAADKDGGVYTTPFTERSEGAEGSVTGVEIHQCFRDMPCTYTLAAKDKPGVSVSYRTAFDPAKPCTELWTDLGHDGQLDSFEVGDNVPTEKGQEVAVAVCAQCTVPGGATGQAEFSLSWHMPVVCFPGKQAKYLRRYVRYFSSEQTASRKIAAHALRSYPRWEDCITKWQTPILQCRSLPSWYKSALFNELYFVSDGGTLWLDPAEEDQAGLVTRTNDPDVPALVKDYSKFAYLEGHEYRMYNTYDVHHYASFALLMLWPKLQLSLQYDIADSVPREQPERVKFCMSGEFGEIKASNSVPHDVGDPGKKHGCPGQVR